MMYARLTKETVKENDAVRPGRAIGQAQAFSPVCLRVCLKLSSSDTTCSDPRQFFPKMPLVTRKLEASLDQRKP